MPSYTRKFMSGLFTLYGGYKIKVEAEKKVNSFIRDGILARIVNTRDGKYSVYYVKSMKRRK
jgi:hypothetical protein